MTVQENLLEQAKDPSTPPKALERLAKYEECRAAVAANPNAPVDVLLRLALAFPREVAGNIGFMLAMMTEPEKLDELEGSTRTLAALCRVAGVPEAVMELGMRSPDVSVQRALLVNPDLPGAYVERLTRSESEEIAAAAPFHRNYGNPPSFDVASVRLELLHEGRASDEAIAFIAGGGVREQEVLEELSRHRSEDVRAAVASSPFAWPELLERLSHDGSGAVKRAVAMHRSAPPKTLGGLALDPNYQQLVAGNLSADAGTLEYLAHTRNEVVRELVAQHPLTPVDVLCDLAADPDAGVRAAVAGNPNTPAQFLSLLAGDHEDQVLEMLANNPLTPDDALYEVMARGSNDALYALLARPKLPGELLGRLTRAVLQQHKPPLGLLQALAEHPCTPGEALEVLARLDEDTGIGEQLALNPATPDRCLVELALNGTYNTRMALAGRSTLPLAALEALQEDPDPSVRDLAEQVAPAEGGRNRNPYRGTDIARFGIRSADDLRKRGASVDPDWERRALKRTLEAASTPLGAFLAVTHPRFNELDVWTRVELDVDWYVRFAAALNPAASREALERLAVDADLRVAAAASERLAA